MKSETVNGGSLPRVVRAPDWLLERDKITQRQWRIKKRRHLKAVIKAMGEYHLGCAYCPGNNGEVGAIDELLEKLWEAHKEQNWPWRSNDELTHRR